MSMARSESEKMLADEPCRGSDPELVQHRGRQRGDAQPAGAGGGGRQPVSGDPRVVSVRLENYLIARRPARS